MNPPDHDRRAPGPPLLSVCAWCGAEGKGPPPGPGQTHGICPDHLHELLEECEP